MYDLTVQLIIHYFQVFGLGNKTYEHYNAMGKYVDKRMKELGASRIYDLGMGDDDDNMEDDFITWKDAMWPKVHSKSSSCLSYTSCSFDLVSIRLDRCLKTKSLPNHRREKCLYCTNTFFTCLPQA